MLKPILLMLVLAALQLPTFAQTQLEMNEQAWSQCAKADAKLNQVYKAVLKRYKDNPLTVSKIQAAERAWLKYRDAEIDAIFPLYNTPKAALEYGSVRSMCKAGELKSLTENRIKELEMWLKMEEGNVCGGSRLFSN